MIYISNKTDSQKNGIYLFYIICAMNREWSNMPCSSKDLIQCSYFSICWEHFSLWFLLFLACKQLLHNLFFRPLLAQCGIILQNVKNVVYVGQSKENHFSAISNCILWKTICKQTITVYNAKHSVFCIRQTPQNRRGYLKFFSMLIALFFCMFCRYPDVWYDEITSSSRFFSLAATLNKSIIGLLVAEVKTKSLCNKEV